MVAAPWIDTSRWPGYEPGSTRESTSIRAWDPGWSSTWSTGTVDKRCTYRDHALGHPSGRSGVSQVGAFGLNPLTGVNPPPRWMSPWMILGLTLSPWVNPISADGGLVGTRPPGSQHSYVLFVCSLRRWPSRAQCPPPKWRRCRCRNGSINI